MDTKARRSEPDELGLIPWGSHFCLFYETQEDLLEVALPYFKQGLERNEYCLWVPATPVEQEEARRALSGTVPGFERLLRGGQIVIIPYTQWYISEDDFDTQRVPEAWEEKVDQALAKGYVGMRSMGNASWLDKQHWDNFGEYEAKLERVLSKLRIRVLCTYALERCSAENVLDVIHQHQFTLIIRRGKWERLERAEFKRLNEEILRLNLELEEHLRSHHTQPVSNDGTREHEQLSSREQEVLRLIAQGQTNKEIAAELSLSVRTVERHRSSMMNKLGLHSTTELIVYAVTHGFLGDEK
jgi:DNA-binding CsgD family transcriptional regulator